LREKIKDRDEICKHFLGELVPDVHSIEENGLKFLIDLSNTKTTGVFLDMRKNRNIILNLIKKQTDKSFLSTFSHSCTISLYAASAGAKTYNIDASEKLLKFGKKNYILNNIDTKQHYFFNGDVFKTMSELRKKENSFKYVILDPPSVSRGVSLPGQIFTTTKYKDIISLAVPLVKQGGYLISFASTPNLSEERWKNQILSTTFTWNKRTVSVTDTFHVRKELHQDSDFRYRDTTEMYLKGLVLQRKDY